MGFGTDKNKKKGARELHSLSCSINYDRIKAGEEQEQSSCRGGSRTQGGSDSTQMKMFTWNVRGLGRPTRRMVVKEMVRKNKVQIALLQD